MVVKNVEEFSLQEIYARTKSCERKCEGMPGIMDADLRESGLLQQALKPRKKCPWIEWTPILLTEARDPGRRAPAKAALLPGVLCDA